MPRTLNPCRVLEGGRYRGNWRCPEAWRTALTRRLTLRPSMPVTASPRRTGMSPARLAARRSILFSPLELGKQTESQEAPSVGMM